MDRIKDILFDIKQQKWFLDYERRHKYESSYVDFYDTIKLLDKRIKEGIKDYEKESGRRIPLYLLKRYVEI